MAYDVIKKYSEFKPIYNPKDIMPIEMGSFGYLSRDVEAELGFKKMETCGLENCVDLILKDEPKTFYVMAHVEFLCLENLDQILLATQQYYPEAILAYSKKVDNEILTKVENFARKHAKIIKKIKQSADIGCIGIDLNGELYKPKGIHQGIIEKNVLDDWLKRGSAFKDMNEYFRSKRN